MIITMKNTETREISAKIDELHEERGEAALGRVLTLLISTNEASLEHDLEVANSASRTRSSTRKCGSVPTPARARSSCCVRSAVWCITRIRW